MIGALVDYIMSEIPQVFAEVDAANVNIIAVKDGADVVCLYVGDDSIDVRVVTMAVGFCRLGPIELNDPSVDVFKVVVDVIKKAFYG